MELDVIMRVKCKDGKKGLLSVGLHYNYSDMATEGNAKQSKARRDM